MKTVWGNDGWVGLSALLNLPCTRTAKDRQVLLVIHRSKSGTKPSGLASVPSARFCVRACLRASVPRACVGRKGKVSSSGLACSVVYVHSSV